jgi:N-acetylglucosamine kinase-like BadF-type ATPase
MPADKAVLAIETGGSRGRAALRRQGRILEHSLPAGLNPNDTGFDLFEERLAMLVGPLLATLPAPADALRLHAVAAMAGTGSRPVMKRCKASIERLLKPCGCRFRLEVLTDVAALARTCITGPAGIVLIAGTGSICLGVGQRRGRRFTARVGGRGSFLDEGSGSVLGLAVLDAALATLERRMEEALLVELICDRYGLAPHEIPRRFLPPVRGEVAGLARVALDAYRRGDRFAVKAVRSSVADLAGLVLDAKAKAGLRRGTFEIFASGGLFKSPVVRRLLKGHLARRMPGARLTFIDDPLLTILAKMGTDTNFQS